MHIFGCGFNDVYYRYNIRAKGANFNIIIWNIFSIVYPTVVLTISKVYSTNSSYVTGIVVTLSSFVNMIISF